MAQLTEIRSTKAAILVESHQPLVLDEITLPERLDYGQVLVQVHYSGICGSQLGEIAAVKGPDKFLPHLLGHEGSGIVLEVGPAVKTVQVGDHVVLHWRKGTGIEAAPPLYQWGSQNINAGSVTTFNEYAIVSENRVTPIPSSFDLELAPLFGCAITTGLGVINNNAQVKIGESVVILGAGGVGLNMIQAAQMVSAYPIIAIDQFDHKLALAETFGATHTLNVKQVDLREALPPLLGSAGADVIIDNTGLPAMIELAYQLTKSKGRVILVGVPRSGNNISIYSLPLHFGKGLKGTEGGEAQPHEDIPRYLRLFEAGKLKLKELNTDSFALTDINLALDKMRMGEITGRCVLKVV